MFGKRVQRVDFFFFQAEDGIRDLTVTGVQTCALPIFNGHLDLIQRGSKIFDELVVAILRNPEKDPLFSLSERRSMLEELTAKFKNVSVDIFDGLTVDYAAKVKAHAVLRGIRALSDYEYELQM